MADVSMNAVLLALRAPALALLVCSTGATTLGESAAGFTRLTGSFVDDGFLVGMEVTPSGFPSNTPAIVDHVAPLLLTIRGGRSVVAESAGRALTVGLPRVQVWDDFEPSELGVALEDVIPGRPFLDEDFTPATNRLVTLGRGGMREERGIYVLKWAGLENTGGYAVRASLDALKALYPAGAGFAINDGLQVRIRTDLAPTVTGPRRITGGWSQGLLTVHWYVETRPSL